MNKIFFKTHKLPTRAKKAIHTRNKAIPLTGDVVNKTHHTANKSRLPLCLPLLFSFILATLSLGLMPACQKQTDYSLYISECRDNIFLYADDNVTVKIYLSQREVPYAADGICGDLSPYTEMFISFATTPQTVKVESDALSGELAYQTAKNYFYLSMGERPDWNTQVELKVIYDDKELECTALSVLSDGLMTATEALDCVTEHAAERFSSLTQNGNFLGEIYIRLLYDEGCWFYVGLTDRTHTTYAYLVDPSNGKILAERTLQN